MLAATLGALLELQQGHAVDSPSVLIPRWIALVQLVVIAVVTALSFTFKKRLLKIVDRIALLAFAASLFVGGDEATRHELPLALIVGGVCVLVAWAYDRIRRRVSQGGWRRLLTSRNFRSTDSSGLNVR
jgi:hypothetical protein